MARKTKLWVAGSDCGRDAGKAFLLTEMPADQGERWATRLILALANGGGKIPDGIMDAGMAGVASIAGAVVLSLRHLQGLRYEDAAPLLDEMMGCVQFAPQGTTPGGERIPPRPLMTGINSELEEISTRMKIRWEVLKLHVDFLEADGLLNTAPSTPAQASPQSTSA